MPRHKEHTQVCWNKDLTLVWKQSAGNEPQKGVPDFSTERLEFSSGMPCRQGQANLESGIDSRIPTIPLQEWFFAIPCLDQTY